MITWTWQSARYQSPKRYQFAEAEGLCLSVKLLKGYGRNRYYRVMVSGQACGLCQGLEAAKRVAERHAVMILHYRSLQKPLLDEDSDWTPR